MPKTIFVNRTDLFKEKLLTILPTINVLGQYGKNGGVKIEVSDEIGIVYSVKPESLLLGSKPCIKTAIDKSKAFIVMAKLKHGETYNYESVQYIHGKQKVKINCKKHGEFLMKPNAHLNGAGCMSCHIENCGWKKNDWVKYASGKLCTFYIIECYNENERFIKAGITSLTIQKRFDTKKGMPYDFNILYSMQSDAATVWDKEKEFLKKNRKNKYIPLLKFKGVHECLNINTII